jgi:hypothetical protein
VTSGLEETVVLFEERPFVLLQVRSCALPFPLPLSLTPSKPQQENQPISFISLRTVVFIRMHEHQKNTIWIKTPHRDYYFRADSAEQAQQWLTVTSPPAPPFFFSCEPLTHIFQELLVAHASAEQTDAKSDDKYAVR